MTRVATPQESGKHKAMKERIARTASRHGLDVQVGRSGGQGSSRAVRGSAFERKQGSGSFHRADDGGRLDRVDRIQ
ncbi:hypothetical protein GCM10010341_75820 [Streptomyces noursei]|nr:hypothetical protein GCM10010341_75820 [Streptomyces noursei]